MSHVVRVEERRFVVVSCSLSLAHDANLRLVYAYVLLRIPAADHVVMGEWETGDMEMGWHTNNAVMMAAIRILLLCLTPASIGTSFPVSFV